MREEKERREPRGGASVLGCFWIWVAEWRRSGATDVIELPPPPFAPRPQPQPSRSFALAPPASALSPSRPVGQPARPIRAPSHLSPPQEKEKRMSAHSPVPRLPVANSSSWLLSGLARRDRPRIQLAVGRAALHRRGLWPARPSDSRQPATCDNGRVQARGATLWGVQ